MRLLFERNVRLASVVSLLLLAACQTADVGETASKSAGIKANNATTVPSSATEGVAGTGPKHPMDGSWSVRVETVDIFEPGSIFCTIGEYGEQDFVVSDGLFSVDVPSNKQGTMKLWGAMEYGGLAEVDVFFTGNKTKFTFDLSSGSGSRTRTGSSGWCRNKFTFSRIEG